MNELGTKVLAAMESSSLGRMSIYVLSKQSLDLGIDMDDMDEKDVIKIADRLKVILPFFLGDETEAVVNQIRRISKEAAK